MEFREPMAPMRRAAPDGSPSPRTGRRTSPQRRLVADVVRAMPGAFTVEELAREVRARRPSVGLATVYRAVAALQRTGFIETAGQRAGHTLYVHCEAHCADDGHHHHLVCTSCGTVAAAECRVEEVAHEVARRSGFRLTDHVVRLYGLCRACDEG